MKFLFFLLVCLTLTACAPQKSAAATDTGGAPGHEFVQTMLSLYRDENKFVRIQAMLLSIDMAPREELVQELRERAKRPIDEIERAAAYYALASITRRHEDIAAFLDAFLYSQMAVFGLVRCENFLASMGDPWRLQNFLTRLTLIPAHRHKSMIALVAVEGWITMPESSNIRSYKLMPTKEEYALGEELHDFPGDVAGLLEFDSEAVITHLLALADSPDMESRVTAYLMLRRTYPYQQEVRDSICDFLYAKLIHGKISASEACILHFTLLSLNNHQWPLWSKLRREYIRILPEDRDGVEQLLSLEKRTYRMNFGRFTPHESQNIAFSTLYETEWEPPRYIFSDGAMRKVQAFLHYGRRIIDDADYEYLAGLFMDNKGFDAKSVEEAHRLISASVAAKYGWPPEEYTIKLYFPDNQELPESSFMFMALHNDDVTPKKPPAPDGGKSVVFEVDMRAMKILKEWGFQ